MNPKENHVDRSDPFRLQPLPPRVIYGEGTAAKPLPHAATTRRGYVPSITGDYGVAGRLEYRISSIAGLSHRITRQVNQDAFAVSWGQASGLHIAVADGLGGSGVFSHLVAHTAVESVCLLLEQCDGEVSDEDMSAAVEETNGLLQRLVQHLGEETLTTLVVATMRQVADGFDVLCQRVGDSTAAVLASLEPPTWTELFPRESGPMADTSTNSALPCQEVATESFKRHLPAGSAFFLMTDGLAVPIFELSQSCRDGLGSLWASPPDIHNFMNQLDFGRRGEHDDRTVAGVWFNAI